MPLSGPTKNCPAASTRIPRRSEPTPGSTTAPRDFEEFVEIAGRGLPWREDPTNESGAYARNRVRNELLPALRAIHPAAEANILRTLEILRDESEVLDSLIDLDPSVERIKALPPALRRHGRHGGQRVVANEEQLREQGEIGGPQVG